MNSISERGGFFSISLTFQSSVYIDIFWKAVSIVTVLFWIGFVNMFPHVETSICSTLNHKQMYYTAVHIFSKGRVFVFCCLLILSHSHSFVHSFLSLFQYSMRCTMYLSWYIHLNFSGWVYQQSVEDKTRHCSRSYGRYAAIRRWMYIFQLRVNWTECSVHFKCNLKRLTVGSDMHGKHVHFFRLNDDESFWYFY